MHNVHLEYHTPFYKASLIYTLFLYKNIAFPAQAEHSYFSANFRLKIFLYHC